MRRLDFVAHFLLWDAPSSWLADRRGAMWRGRVVPRARAWPVAIRESDFKKERGERLEFDLAVTVLYGCDSAQIWCWIEGVVCGM